MEYAETVYHSIGSGGMVGVMPSTADQRGDLQYITDRINECVDAASKAAERVSMVADRVKGATPECKPVGSGLASGGLGSIAEIHSRLDVLTNALCAVSDNIARIERL